MGATLSERRVRLDRGRIMKWHLLPWHGATFTTMFTTTACSRGLLFIFIYIRTQVRTKRLAGVTRPTFISVGAAFARLSRACQGYGGRNYILFSCLRAGGLHSLCLHKRKISQGQLFPAFWSAFLCVCFGFGRPVNAAYASPPRSVAAFCPCTLLRWQSQNLLL